MRSDTWDSLGKILVKPQWLVAITVVTLWPLSSGLDDLSRGDLSTKDWLMILVKIAPMCLLMALAAYRRRGTATARRLMLVSCGLLALMGVWRWVEGYRLRALALGMFLLAGIILSALPSKVSKGTR